MILETRFKRFLSIGLILSVSTIFASCASAPRTKWTDKTMRVMIDPDSISADHHVAIQKALVESGKWFVVDRAKGYQALKAEQERLHRDEEDRYADREKYAHWGKMYGVGGIVVAAAQCKKKQGFFFGGWSLVCKQYLSIVDANTGEVIAAIEEENSSDSVEIVPTWDDAVAKLNSAYPDAYKAMQTSERIENYKELSAEEAQRARERKPANLGN